jgi:predicted AlkP superfamily pyrophosphatase or phosphodiesterase
MIPIFPTKTFPNHYTIVTGLYAEQHGVVGNTMYDPMFDATFTMRKREEVIDGRWWGGEPIWVTAEKQGLVSSCYYWPGSEALIATKRPTYWKKYDGTIPYAERVRQVLEWLDYPEVKRPSLITLYFEGVEHAGHEYGPDIPRVNPAIREADSAVGLLLQGLASRKMREHVNIVVVSDHGMAAVHRSRTIWLGDLIDLDSVPVVDMGTIVSLWPPERLVEDVFRKVSGVRGMRAYRKAEIPERWHYRDHRRVGPILLVADEGWTIAGRQGTWWRQSDSGGNHGFDNQASSMRALFVAAGPSFRQGVVMKPFENVHVYSLLARLLSLTPAPTDGDPRTFEGALK